MQTNVGDPAYSVSDYLGGGGFVIQFGSVGPEVKWTGHWVCSPKEMRQSGEGRSLLPFLPWRPS